MVIFVVNGLAFLLVGLQLPTVIERAPGLAPAELLGLAAALICLTVIVVRLVWVYPATYLPRWLIPSLARRDPVSAARRRRSSSAGAACGARSPWPPRWRCR